MTKFLWSSKHELDLPYLERCWGRLSWFGLPEPRPGAFTDCDRQWCGEPYLLKNIRIKKKKRKKNTVKISGWRGRWGIERKIIKSTQQQLFFQRFWFIGWGLRPGRWRTDQFHWIAYLISKSRISSDVMVLVTSSNCRIFSSRFFFLSPILAALPSFWPCSTLTNSPSFFSRKTSTALSRLNEGCRHFPIITTNVFHVERNQEKKTIRKRRKKWVVSELKEKPKRQSGFVWAHFHQSDFYVIYCNNTSNRIVEPREEKKIKLDGWWCPNYFHGGKIKNNLILFPKSILISH